MGTEIERKFLVKVNELPDNITQYPVKKIAQGYLLTLPAVRVRLVLADEAGQGFITIKGPGLLKRKEFEFRIPQIIAVVLLRIIANRSNVIHKIRYLIGRWEVDAFLDNYAPLWLAEIELDHETERFGLPSFVGKEVTYDKRYSNAELAKHGIPLDYVQE